MFLKILNEDMIHNEFQYKEGLNTDTNPFDSTPDCRGGLFFAEAKDILNFTGYGTKIAVVTVPDGETVIEVSDCGDKKYKAHQIILSDIRDLWTVETFGWLVAQGADIHAQNDYALRWATKNGHLKMVKYLVEQSANIHAGDDDALRLAARYGYLEVVKYLVEQGADIHAGGDCALQMAAGNGHLEVVKFLVAQGADIHANGDYSLQWAAANGHLEVVRFLVAQGADIHADGDLALQWAARNGHLAVADYLERKMKLVN